RREGDRQGKGAKYLDQPRIQKKCCLDRSFGGRHDDGHSPSGTLASGARLGVAQYIGARDCGAKFRSAENDASLFFQAEDGIRDWSVTGVQTCALPILMTATYRSTRHRTWSPSSETRRCPS